MSVKASRAITLVVILGVPSLCLIIYALLMLDCDRDIKSPHPAVDIGPLMAVDWPSDVERITDIMDPAILESHEVWSDGAIVEGMLVYTNPRRDTHEVARVYVSIMALGSIESTKNAFAEWCATRGSYHDRSEFTYGDTGDMQYCISYVRETRSGVSGLCLPLRSYESLAIIRKHNVVIILMEKTGNKSKTQKDDVIKRLAEAFSSQNPGNRGD